MFTRHTILVIFIIGIWKVSYPQSFLDIKPDNFQLAVFGNYVTSAEIEINPLTSNSIDRFSSEEINGGFGVGFSVKKRIFLDNFYISLSTEYIKINDDQNAQYIYNNDTNYLKVRVYETIWMVPVELSFIFDVPSIADELKIYFGGGLGIYFGDRKRRIINFETETLSTSPKLNLQVLCGMEYKFSKNISAIMQFNFRDAQFNIHNRYTTDRFVYQGYDYFFEQDMYSKIYFDGLKICLGLSYNF